MDFIPFSKTPAVSGADLLDDLLPRPGAPAKDPLRQRLEALRAPQRAPEELAPLTFKWLAKMPPAQRPQALPRKFPRIANRLAYVWQWPLQCERYLDELMMDERGGRQGFPEDVAQEIAALKAYFLKRTAHVRYDVWGHRIGGRD